MVPLRPYPGCMWSGAHAGFACSHGSAYSPQCGQPWALVLVVMGTMGYCPHVTPAAGTSFCLIPRTMALGRYSISPNSGNLCPDAVGSSLITAGQHADASPLSFRTPWFFSPVSIRLVDSI